MSQFNPQDKYFKKAKEQGFRARSVFKLEAIQERFGLIKPNMKVLDLGAAPGSFLQYIGQMVGEKGIAVGVDLQEIKALPQKNVHTYQGDIFDEKIYETLMRELKIREFDLITSDLAPKTTGIKFVDGGVSFELNKQVLEVAKAHLKKGGSLIMKTLSGFNEGDLIGSANLMFKKVRKFRPEAVRSSSGESYIICLNFSPSAQ